MAERPKHKLNGTDVYGPKVRKVDAGVGRAVYMRAQDFARETATAWEIAELWMTPDEARAIAADLLSVADRAEAENKKRKTHTWGRIRKT